MTAIRAHFDGRAIVPDEPLTLQANTKVWILVEDATSTKEEQAIREYYQNMVVEDQEDDRAWSALSESSQGWEKE